MSEKKKTANSSIQQYEPPRVPASWDFEGKRFAQRLVDIFDDIYRRFGRLKMEDLGADLREKISSVADEDAIMESVVQQLPGEISATIKQYGLETALVKINDEGVAVKTMVDGVNNAVQLGADGVTIGSTGSLKAEAGGYVGIQAGDSSNSYINLGSVFSASASDGVQASKAEFRELIVNGVRITGQTLNQFPVFFSTVQPTVSRCVWLKPVSGGITGGSSTASYSYQVSGTGSANYLPGGANRSYTLTGSNGLVSGGTQYTYKISFTVINLSSSNRAEGTLTARIGSVTIGSFSIGLGVNQSKVCEATVMTTTNLCASTSVNVTISSTCTGAVYLKNNTSVMLDATGNASSGGDSSITAPLCEVHFVY